MRFMLDTNVCIAMIRDKPRGLLDRMTSLAPGEVGISSVTLAELQFGVAKSAKPEQNAEALIDFCAAIDLSAFDDRAAETYGQVRAALETQGTPIGPLDTLIAAHALSLGATLITNNRREFLRVPGLRIEDWLDA